MIFKRIKLKNFKQYKYETEFSLAIPDEKGNKITLFIGENGSGKTTLLQAIRYCFYGASMYLNLPDSTNLLNHDLIDELKEMDETSLYVEVEFIHNNITYIARREKTFKKQYNKINSIGAEGFDLAYLDNPKKGFVSINNMKKFDHSIAMDKLREILPEGLSQVFMFDGERMEMNISDSKFSKDLQESVIGILGIKKYETLIKILGNPGKASTVLGQLNSRKQSSNPVDKIRIDEFKDLQQRLESEKDQLEVFKIELENLENRIELSKEDQRKIAELNEITIRKNNLEIQIDKFKEKIDNITKTYIIKSYKAINFKIILNNKNKLQQFFSKKSSTSKHYDQLHIKTIEDVQNRKICICGRPIEEHTQEYDVLENLKKTSLPVENSQYMNLVSEYINGASEFNDILSELKDLRAEKVHLEKDIDVAQKEIFYLVDEINKIEKVLGLSNQEMIDELYNQKIEIEKQKSIVEERIRLIEIQLDKRKFEISKIDSSITFNQKINKVIGVIEEIKNELTTERDTLDRKARKLLKENFNKSFNDVISGNYDVVINDEYRIKIMDLESKKDVTTVLSTGQNVIVSLSFIDALIKTAKEMSMSINNNNHYGVFMDAALSNLDEKHIEKLCKFNLNKMDQLIFLSFKKQLRDEMYRGIKEQIGKAYIIENNKTKGVSFQEIPIIDLDKYIHEIEVEING